MKHSFSLRCAYPIANFSGEKTQPLIRVCAEHSAVLFDENDESSLEGTAKIALRCSEERFRLLADAVQDYAIFMLDTHGRVSTWNKSAERIKGYKNSEIIGRHFSIFYPEEDRLARKPQRELEIAKKEGRLEDEGWRIRKDGSRFWANVIITALRDDARRAVRLVSEHRTVTLQIIDEGHGIRPENVDRPGQDWMGAMAVGLRGMNERINQLRGSLSYALADAPRSRLRFPCRL